ncbi:cytochrome c3 family protein [bacterium]|nr:cytochrome c3 family protein [bacterium]
MITTGWLIYAGCGVLCRADGGAPVAAVTDKSHELIPLLPWHGESPYWQSGQEFSAVVDSPFTGSSYCVECHASLAPGFLKTAHARSLNDVKMPLDRQGCEGCHGAGGAHAALLSRGAVFAFDWKDPTKHNLICLRCHEWLTTQAEWEHTSHARGGIRCTDCHDPHVPADHDQRFLLRERPDTLCVNCHQDIGHDFFRMRRHPIVLNVENSPSARAMHCTDCHDVHRGGDFRMLADDNVRDLCLKCHIEKDGPFRFPHLAMAEGVGGSCLDCHLPHGSDNPWLLVADGRQVCLQCHTDQIDHQPALTCWTAGCHEQVHGSNESVLLMGE